MTANEPHVVGRNLEVGDQRLEIRDPAAIYIHIPFCHHRCSYCDFNIYAGMKSLYKPYAQAVAQEIAATAGRIGRVRVPTIFIGGGTPSMFPVDLIGGILANARAFFDVAPDAEITLEANPAIEDKGRQTRDGSVPSALHSSSQEYFARLRALGVNRLSLGVQSGHAHELYLLRRGHSFGDAADTFQSMRRAGFDNLNIDLIYGLPNQTLEEWRTTLERALALQPDHVSAYSLQVEEGTAMFNWVRDRRVPSPDDDLAADMYNLAEEMLGRAGFTHYEISNWAQPGQESRHNLVYWLNRPYFGMGCGAHSSYNNQRYSNVLHPREYIQRMNTGVDAVVEREEIGRTLEMGETMMLGLRLVEQGVDRARFKDRFDIEVDQAYGPIIERLVNQGLLEVNARRLRLTPRWRLLGNRVFAEFLPDPV